jgi:hypothetical protein
MRFQYKLLALAAISIAATQTIAPAKALPGKSVKSFLLWAKNRSIPTLQHSSKHSRYKHNLYYYAQMVPQTDNIQKQSVKNKDTTVRFSKYNEKALKVILKLYGSQITDDSKNSHVVKVGLQKEISRTKYCKRSQCNN